MTSLQFALLSWRRDGHVRIYSILAFGWFIVIIFGSFFCRSLETFWPTTGLFPQEFIISFSTLMSIGNIKISSANGKIPQYTWAQWNLNITKGQGTWLNLFALMRFRCIEVLFHMFYYYWGKETHSLYWEIHYPEVHYNEVSLFPLYGELRSEVLLYRGSFSYILLLLG